MSMSNVICGNCLGVKDKGKYMKTFEVFDACSPPNGEIVRLDRVFI